MNCWLSSDLNIQGHISGHVLYRKFPLSSCFFFLNGENHLTLPFNIICLSPVSTCGDSRFRSVCILENFWPGVSTWVHKRPWSFKTGFTGKRILKSKRDSYLYELGLFKDTVLELHNKQICLGQGQWTACIFSAS